MLDRFGHSAISDRPLRGGTVMELAQVDRIKRVVEERREAKSVLEWEFNNPDDAALWNRLMDRWPIEDYMTG